MPIQGALHAEIIARSNGTDTPIGATDLSINPASGSISGGLFTYDAEAKADIAGPLAALQCGDKLVLRLTILPGTNMIGLWPVLDVP